MQDLARETNSTVTWAVGTSETGIYYNYIHKDDAQGINIKWRAWPQARLAMDPAGSS